MVRPAHLTPRTMPDTNLSVTNSSCSQPTCDDLLRPEYFDWADECEESLYSTAPPPPSSPLSNMAESIPSFDDLAESDIYPSSRPFSRQDYHGGQEALEPIDEEDDEYESDDESDMYEEQEFTMLTPATSTSPCSDDTLVDEVAMTDSQTTRMEADYEFGWRRFETSIDHNIHHYNFWGQPVYQRSSTPPSHSLAVIMSGPKSPRMQRSLRVMSTLSRAFQFVDPVIFDLDGTTPTVLHQRGFDLQRAATGCVSPFYTPHGSWIHDNSEEMADHVCDNGDMKTYMSEDVVVGNGFIGRRVILSREDWANIRDEKMAASEFRGRPRKITWQPKPSPLRQSETCELNSPEIEANVTELQDQLSDGHSLEGQNSLDGHSLGGDTEAIEYAGESSVPDTNQPVDQEGASSSVSKTNTKSGKQRRHRQRQQRRQHRQRLTRPLPEKAYDISRDPNIYFSFPEPETSDDPRGTRLKRGIKRAWKKFTSSLGV